MSEGPNGCTCGFNGDCNCPFVPSPVAAAPRNKRRKGKSPTSRTLDECRKRGWTAQVVEHRVPRLHVTRDLFGVIDVVAIVTEIDTAVSYMFGEEPRRVGKSTIGIQATASAAHHAHRRAKILAEPRARQWVEAGNRLELWSWAKQGARGKRKQWRLRVERFVISSGVLQSEESDTVDSWRTA